VIDRFGNTVETLTDAKLLDGPWDLAVRDGGDQAQVFVTNVLSGTVTRIDFQIPAGGNPIVLSKTQIASGYLIRTDSAAFVVGPTGLAYDADKDVLYVASTGDNAIFAIPSAAKRANDAGMGDLVSNDNAHLHGPLGLALAPNGDLLTSNGDAVNPDPNQLNEIVEFTATGQFVAEIQVDTTGTAGGAFGIALKKFGNTVNFAAVDDNFNSLEISVAHAANHNTD
jgi:DNA-binding beta-propeller fold protein YncE